MDKAIKIEPEDDDNAGDQQQRQPPRKMTKNIKGQKRDYYFLQSVKSVEELDKLRFKNYCTINFRKALPTFKSLIVPCTRKKRFKLGKKCGFELMAVRQKSGTIDVYAHSEHNHPIMPEENRANIRNAKELMSAENPPRIYRTPDNTEWTFLQTFANFDQLQKFRRKSQCANGTERESYRRVRLTCWRKRSNNCQFKLLALKNTNAGYHVYTFSEHNHLAVKPKPRKKQQPAPAANGHQQKQQEQEMEVDEDEDDEHQDENEAEEDNEEEDEAEDDDEEDGIIVSEDEEDIILIDDEDDEIKVEQKQEVKQEGSMAKTTGTPPANEATPREETLEEKLQNANAKVYKWMAGFEPNQIGPILEEWDTDSLLKMVEMAEQEIRQHPAKFDVWRPWLKVAIKKCLSQIEGFSTKYKDLIILLLDE